MKPPRHTTPAKLVTKYEGTTRNSIVRLKDMDCFSGVSGVVTYLKQEHKRFEELGSFEFDGVWPIEEDNAS